MLRTMIETLDGNKALVVSLFDAIWSGDEPAIRALLAEEFEDFSGPPGAPKGAGPTIDWARGMRAVFPDMKVTIEQAVAEADLVAVHATWRGTHEATFLGIAPTHRRISFTGMVFWRVSGGRISGRWATLDMASVLRQLQAPPGV